MRFGAGTFGLGARAGCSHFSVWTLILVERVVRLYVEPLLGQASPQVQREWVCAKAAEGDLRAGMRFGADIFGLGARAGCSHFSVWTLIYGGYGRKALC